MKTPAYGYVIMILVIYIATITSIMFLYFVGVSQGPIILWKVWMSALINIFLLSSFFSVQINQYFVKFAHQGPGGEATEPYTEGFPKPLPGLSSSPGKVAVDRTPRADS